MIPKNRNISLSRLIQVIRRRGILNVIIIILIQIRVVITDMWFDLKNGTDTTSPIELDELFITSNNKELGTAYEPTAVLVLRKLFARLVIPNNSILVDFGCGKGRVLMIASEFGFKEVRGVDFSSKLCKIAINNCQKYKEKMQSTIIYRIFQSDVVDYQIKNDENVFYLFNPFGAEILDQVLNNIQLSLSDNPRKIWIIYYNPKFQDIIKNMNQYIKENEISYGPKYTIFVYTNIFV